MSVLPTASAEIEQGRNYDRELIGFKNGDPVYRQTIFLHDRIVDHYEQGKPVYANYKLTDIGNQTKVETEQGSVILNEITCSFSFYPKGYIGATPALFTDSIIAKRATVNTTNWSSVNTINNASCVPQVEANVTSVILSAFKSKPAVGSLKYQYIYQNGVWKTNLIAINNSTLTDQKFGFTQNIDLKRNTIKFGNQTINLSNFNGTIFDQNWINSHQGKVLDLLNGHTFDFDIAFNQLDTVQSFGYANGDGRLVFNYLKTNTILSPGKVLRLDPTFTSNNPTVDGEILTNSAAAAACPTTSFTKQNGTEMRARIPTAAAADGCSRSYVQWDISTIPSLIVAQNVTFGFEINNQAGTGNCDYNAMQFRPSTTSAANVWGDIGNGTSYLANDSTCDTIGTNKLVVFNSAARDDVRAKRLTGVDSFAIGIKLSSETRGGSVIASIFETEEGASPTPAPTLTVEYRIPSHPDAVTVLDYSGLTETTLDLAWTAPALNGETLSGYQVNYTTPYGPPQSIIVNDTHNAGTIYTVSGLTLGTPYSFRVSAQTLGTTNASGKILNVTTLDFQTANYTVGSFDINATNLDVVEIFFERQAINSSATFLNVTYPNTANMACDFSYRFAMSNQTYYNLTGYAIDSDREEYAFTFVNYTNDQISAYCWDQLTNNNARYLLTFSSFPLLDQVNNFRNGTYGTMGIFGIFDFIGLAVIILSMIGFNRVNEAVGAIFCSIIIGALTYFDIISLPTTILTALIVIVMLTISTTRKD